MWGCGGGTDLALLLSLPLLQLTIYDEPVAEKPVPAARPADALPKAPRNAVEAQISNVVQAASETFEVCVCVCVRALLAAAFALHYISGARSLQVPASLFSSVGCSHSPS